MSIRERNRIEHRFSERELEILNEIAAREGFSDFRSYYNIKLHAIVERSNPDMMIGCDNCHSKGVKFHLPAHLLEELTILANNNCTNISRMAERLIVNPLLSLYFKNSGF